MDRLWFIFISVFTINIIQFRQAGKKLNEALNKKLSLTIRIPILDSQYFGRSDSALGFLQPSCPVGKAMDKFDIGKVIFIN